MKKNMIKVAIIGGGSRGLDSYAKSMVKDGRYEINAVCDFRDVRLKIAHLQYGVKKENLFLKEEDFFKEKRGDLLVVSTQDQDHVRHAITGLKLGYDVLCEKPISPSKSDCLKLLEAQKKYNHKVIVCHVLRYAPAYLKVKKLIEKGTIGTLIDIYAIEQVTYWHIAHSFVRGNWRREDETSPMILAKCCHDMDLLQYFADSKCEYISSMGDLTFFKKENQPKGASNRCDKCKFYDTCVYSAKNVYIKQYKENHSPKSMWPQNVVCPTYPLSENKIINAYKKNQYGRCVFECDNNVVDHQNVIAKFKNGVTATLCMMGFTKNHGRIYKFHGTYGEVQLNEEREEIVVKKYGKKNVVLKFNALPDVTGGHGGGDSRLVADLYDALTTKGKLASTLENSIESHLMCFAAEESRKENGKLIKLH